MITEEWKTFKNNCARKEIKDLRKWDLDMRRMNIGSVTLGSRGYDGKRSRWENEDVDPLTAAKIKPWEEFEDRRQRECIRARCYRDKKRGICNIQEDGVINCRTGSLSTVAFNQVGYILIVTFLNSSYVFL
jgi:hypothetical protein